MTKDRKFLLALAAVGLIGAIAEAFLPEPRKVFNEVGVVQAFLYAVLLFGWCKEHARTKGIQPPPGAPLFVALFCPIGIPYYALKGFGFGKGMKLVGWCLLFWVGLAVVSEIVYEIVRNMRT